MRMKWAAFLALLALPGQVLAVAQPICLPRAQAETLVVALLPTLIETVHGRCMGRLSSRSALMRNGQDQAAQYRPAAEEAKPAAEDIASNVLQANTDIALPPEMSDVFGFEMFEAGAQSAIEAALNDDACLTVDRIFTALQPLPARNFAALIVMLLELGQRDAPLGEAPFRVCTA